MRRASIGDGRLPSFLAGALSLSIGSALGQLVMVAAMPVLSRVYSPGAYGSLAIVATTATLFSVGAAGRYDIAIILPRRTDTARLLFRLAFSLISLTVVVALLAVLAFRKPFAGIFGDRSLEDLLWWMPLTVLAMGGYEAFNNWLTRRGNFGGIATARVTRATGTVGAQLAMGGFGLGALGLVAGQAVGQLSSLGVMWAAARRDLRAPLKTTVRRLKVVASRYRDFPKFNVPQAVLDAASQQLPVVVLGTMFGSGPVGWFWFTHRIFQLGTELVGQSVRQVLLHRISEGIRTGAAMGPLFKRVSGALTLMSVLPAVVLCLWGPWIFSTVFGDDWYGAGAYARWLAVAWVGIMATQPSIAMVFALELQRGQFIWEVLMFLGRIVGLLAGAAVGGAGGAVAGYALTTAAANGILVVWVWRGVRAHDERKLGPVRRRDTSPVKGDG